MRHSWRKRSALLLVLAVSVPLAACQSGERQAGGGAGMQAESPLSRTETAGDHFEDAYTDLAETHISLVQGDWDRAAENMREVREGLEAMTRADAEGLSAVVTSRINALQRSALNLDELIASRDPAAVEASRTLMTTFTRESSLAQVGREGGGAGQASPGARRQPMPD